jgi:hypothetical protein
VGRDAIKKSILYEANTSNYITCRNATPQRLGWYLAMIINCRFFKYWEYLVDKPYRLGVVSNLQVHRVRCGRPSHLFYAKRSTP